MFPPPFSLHGLDKKGSKYNFGLGGNISYLWTYDLYGPVRNAFDAGKSITRASGRGLCQRSKLQSQNLLEINKKLKRT